VTVPADLVLFDDAVARGWQPFALTRPAGELMFGAFTLRARTERILGMRCVGAIASPHLRGFEEPGAPPVVAAGDVSDARGRLFLSARAVPEWGASFAPPARTAAVYVGSEPAGVYVPAGVGAPDVDALAGGPDGDERVDLPGRMLRHVWELMAGGPHQVTADVAAAAPAPAAVLPGTSVIGAAADLRAGADVTIEPGVVIDTTGGPVWLDDGVTVRAFTRLAGPAYIGQGTTLLGGPFTAVVIGPQCKVHGEMEESVVLGYSNKAHDGFLGHAYLGRWVNLGALTTNSDLKNNYGRIRLWTPDGEVDTGEIKVGCFLGDHVKTGIGVMLNTGTVIGAGSNVVGAVQPPKYVPPFSWGAGEDLGAYDLERFLSTAATVMARRKVRLTDGMRGVLEAAWHLARGETA
jgi:UDP-N-acetylglucosamine diphosphorylase/glucosamine-1-phosphate N-acetyltransferase